MNKNIKILLIVLVFNLIYVFFAISVGAASTAYNADQLALMKYSQSIMPDKQTAPISVEQTGEEIINTASGNLQMEVTDLYLPGKGGLDVVVNRRISNQTAPEFSDEIYNVNRTMSIFDTKKSEKKIYKYFINDTNEYVYIYFDSDEQMLSIENDNGEIFTSNEFREKIIPYNTSPGIHYKDFFSGLSGAQSDDIAQKGFIKYYELPLSTEVKLTRDRSLIANKVYYESYNAYDDVAGYISPRFYDIYDGWYYTKDRMIEKGSTSEGVSTIHCEVYGNFITKDGQLLNYEARYSIRPSGEIFNQRGKIISEEGTSEKYDIYYDYPGDSMTEEEIEEMGFSYCKRIEDYMGNNLYFDYEGNIVAESDRYGNKILYNKDTGTIIDTYGRTITLLSQNNELMVDNTVVAKYERSVINNDKIDPYNVLTVDDKRNLVVKYAGDNDQSYTYTMTEHNNLYRLQPETILSATAYKCDITEAVKYYTLDEIIMPSGGKKQYFYDKVNTYFIDDDLTREKLKLISKQTVLSDGTVIDKYNYSYSNPTEGLQKNNEDHTTTVTRDYDGYTAIEQYSKDGYLISRKETLGDECTENIYQYINGYEGDNKITSHEIKQYKTSSPDQYSYKKTEYTYEDNRIQLQQQKTANRIENYDYELGLNNYPFLTSREVSEEGNSKYVRMEYNNDGKSITRKYTYDATSSTKDTVKTDSYDYNDNGDLIYDKSTNMHYSYEYQNVSDAVNNPSQNTLKKTSYIFSDDSIIDDNGNVILGTVNVVSEYNLFGNIVKQTDSKGNVTSYEYDGRQRLIKTTFPDGKFTTTEYDDENNEIITTDENGNKQRMCYDSIGRYINGYVYDPDNDTWIHAEEISYTSDGYVSQLISYRNKENTDAVKVVYTYYPGGRIKSETVYNMADESILSSYTVGDKIYNIDESIAEGQPQRYTISWDETYFKDSENYTKITKKYDLFDNLIEETISGVSKGIAETPRTQKYTYDYRGNLISVQDANSVASGSDDVTSYEYNAIDKVIKTIDAEGNESSNDYNYNGLLRTTTDFNGNSMTYTYNCFNQVMKEENAAGGKTLTYYDVNGNTAKTSVLREKNGSNEIYDSTSYLYDNRNRLSAVIGNDGEMSVTQYTYDGVGNMESMITGLSDVTDIDNIENANCAVTTYEYDYLNNCTSVTDPLGNTATYTYDLFGNVLTSTDKNGDSQQYTYTPLGQLSKITAYKGDDVTQISFTYDAFGNRTSMTDETGITQYEYNTYNELIKETSGNIVKEYTYDSNGNNTSFNLSGTGAEPMAESYSYNSLNQMTGASLGGVSVSMSYDNNGNLTRVSRGGIVTDYTYNTNNTVASVVTKRGSTQYESDTFTYYLNGNRKSMSDVNGNTKTYVYDGMNRLSEEHSPTESVTYEYDRYGNRSKENVNNIDSMYTISYNYDKNNRLIEEIKTENWDSEVTRYYYDSNGNQVYKNAEKILSVQSQDDTRVQIRDGGIGTSYEYDGLNRLIRTDDGANVSEYTYNGDNLRTSKTVNGETTSHIYKGMNVIQEQENGSYKASYYRVGARIMYSDADGGRNYYIYNGEGNVTKLLDGTYTLRASYTFDAFGNQSSDGEVYNPFRYKGEYYDEETEIIYLRNRYYSSSTGRFITEDPVQDGLNWYVYAGNNPVSFVDPSGLSANPPRDMDWNGDALVDTDIERRMFDKNGNKIADWIEDGYSNAQDWYGDMTVNQLPDFPFVRQGHGMSAELCWDLSVKETIQWLTGREFSIEQIAINEFNKGGIFDKFICNNGLNVSGVRNHLVVNNYFDGSRYMVNESHFNTREDTLVKAEFIKNEIDMGRPMLLDIYYAGHMVVIVGYDYSDPNNKKIICQDSAGDKPYDREEKFDDIRSYSPPNQIIAFERAW